MHCKQFGFVYEMGWYFPKQCIYIEWGLSVDFTFKMLNATQLRIKVSNEQIRAYSMMHGASMRQR